MNIEDRQAIADLISAYSYGYDTLDWDLFGSIFAPDAVMGTGVGEVQTRHYQTNTLLNDVAMAAS